jgi:AcrR family transcriptional regulator
MPRRYRMSARAQSTAHTRERIVLAAKDLHAERGFTATSMDEIAERAGVSVATAYRHFPTLAALIPACATTVFNLSGLPTPELAGDIFGDAATPGGRLERLIRGTCDCYLRSAGWLNAARREEELIVALHEAISVQRESLEILTRAAFADAPVREDLIRVISALLDFPLWKSLLDAGFSEEEAANQVVELVHMRLASEELA